MEMAEFSVDMMAVPWARNVSVTSSGVIHTPVIGYPNYQIVAAGYDGNGRMTAISSFPLPMENCCSDRITLPGSGFDTAKTVKLFFLDRKQTPAANIIVPTAQ